MQVSLLQKTQTFGVVRESFVLENLSMPYNIISSRQGLAELPTTVQEPRECNTEFMSQGVVVLPWLITQMFQTLLKVFNSKEE
jgi:hypothetical protein